MYAYLCSYQGTCAAFPHLYRHSSRQKLTLLKCYSLLSNCEVFRHTVSINMEEKLAWFEKLYDTHSDAIFRHLYLRLGDRERAKELMQDVFMRAWQQVAKGKEIQHEKAWLYRAAHNAFVNEIRTDKRSHSLETMMEEVGYDVADESADTSDAADHYELLAYLDQLKDSYRTVLVMRYIDDLPIVEIAKALDESETNISMRVARALEKLKSLYEKQPPPKEV